MGGYSWKSDVSITDPASARLSGDSVVRMKLFTIDNRFIAKHVGVVQKKDWKEIQGVLRDEVLDV